jgi:hypothetical protein
MSGNVMEDGEQFRQAIEAKVHQLEYLKGIARDLTLELGMLTMESFCPSMGDHSAAGIIKCFDSSDEEVINTFRAWMKSKITEIDAEFVSVARVAAEAGWRHNIIHVDNVLWQARNWDFEQHQSYEDLLRSAKLLAKAIRLSEARNARQAALFHKEQPAEFVVGCPIRDGSDGSSACHLLKGQRLHPGEGVRLLSTNGWVRGRFSVEDGVAMFTCRPIPGSSREVAFTIDATMEFAWNNEFPGWWDPGA